MFSLNLRPVGTVLLLILAAVLLVGLAGPVAPAVQAAPGQLDPTFAGFTADGVVIETGVGSLPQYGRGKGLALQPDGKVVSVSRNGPNLVVFRHQPNGLPDAGFGGGDGRAEIPPPEGIVLHPAAVALQSNGKIVVVGRTTSGLDDNSDFLLVRLTAAGELDPSFAGEGILTTNFSGNQDEAHAVVTLPDDRIAVCGTAYVGGDADFAVARYLPDGAPDTAFSNDGKTTIPFGDFEGCLGLARQLDGKLVLVGFLLDDSDDFAVARLELNGTLDDDSNDDGFGGDGRVVTNLGDDEDATDVVIQPDGKIVVLGAKRAEPDGHQSHIARYLPNGALDGSFGAGGKRTIPGDLLVALELQPDGKLLMVGRYSSAEGNDFAFYRLLPNGDFDPAFDEDGVLWADFGHSFEYGTDLTLLPDGRLLALGTSGARLTLVRLWPDGTRDTGGTQTHGLAAGSNEVIRALAGQPDGAFLVAGEVALAGSGQTNAFVTRFHAEGRVDTSFGNLGTLQPPAMPFFPPAHRGARALALQPDGKLVMGGYADWSNLPAKFLVVRWNSDGTPDFSFGFSGWKLVDFAGNGDDSATALAVAPDGKLVVAGNVWHDNSSVWGVARLTSTGALDPTFGPNHDGLAYVALAGPNAASAVVVQPDGKIVIAGHGNGDFALTRLLASGLPDMGFGAGGTTLTDLGGNDGINALALAPDGWLYAAGYHGQTGNVDMALAQYRPDGTLAECPSGPGAPACNHWPDGQRLVNLGGSDSAFALALRGDGQLLAAGCSDLHMAAVQVSTRDDTAAPLVFQAGFAGPYDCAFGVQFTGTDQSKFVLAGQQSNGSEGNIALARFETTAAGPPLTPTPPATPADPFRLYLPSVLR